MYSKEEASKLRQQFWITFGKYMKPIPSAESLPVNWVNYKTGVKHVFFRMNAEQGQTIISIDITHPDPTDRKRFYEQFIAFKKLFADAVNEEWSFQENAVNEYDISLSQLSKTLKEVSVFNQQDWPTIISFLKPRIIALDQFWSAVKPVFEGLD